MSPGFTSECLDGGGITPFSDGVVSCATAACIHSWTACQTDTKSYAVVAYRCTTPVCHHLSTSNPIWPLTTWKRAIGRPVIRLSMIAGMCSGSWQGVWQRRLRPARRAIPRTGLAKPPGDTTVTGLRARVDHLVEVQRTRAGPR